MMQARVQSIVGAAIGCSIMAMGAPAFSQSGGSDRALELGAQVCGGVKLAFETEPEFRARMEREVNTPSWVYAAERAMFEGGDRMSFTARMENGQKILMASGAIDDGAAERLRAALKANSPIGEVWFNSPGGNSRVGTEMGEILRSEMIATRVRKGHGCASACSTAFIGGIIRDVEPGAGYGVHMYSTQLSDDAVDYLRSSMVDKASAQSTYNTAQQRGAEGAAVRAEYVLKMGVSTKWLGVWSRTNPGCMTYMSQQELRDLFVDNSD